MVGLGAMARVAALALLVSPAGCFRLFPLYGSPGDGGADSDGEDAGADVGDDGDVGGDVDAEADAERDGDLDAGAACEGVRCRIGCECVPPGLCAPMSSEIAELDDWCESPLPEPTCMGEDLVVTTAADELDGGSHNTDRATAAAGAGLSLREALVLARNLGGPRRITFDPSVSEIGPSLPLGQLPEVPALTHLDGGGDTTIRSDGSTRLGIVVSGTGAVVSGLHLYGFEEHAVQVRAGASDVHLYGLRIGEPGTPSGAGISVSGPSRRIVIGRGRELACVDPVLLPYDAPTAQFDVNVIVATDHHGITVSDVSGLLIYGTWVGFSPDADDGPAMGNAGAGIALTRVTDAHVGVAHVDAEDAAAGLDEARASFVIVGRSGAEGVRITEGGRISMPGLMVGNTPYYDPFEENRGGGVMVRGTTGPVWLGPAAEASGLEAAYFSHVYTDTQVAVTLDAVAAPVWLRGMQIVTVPTSTASHAVKVVAPDALVQIYHLSITGTFLGSVVHTADYGPGGAVELVNCLIWGSSPLSAVIQAPSFDRDALRVEGNMRWNVAEWCPAPCADLSDANHDAAVDPIDGCPSSLPVPLSPDCPHVDAALRVGLDVNGGRPGLFTGCGPDIGAFECVTPECEAASCP